MKNCEHCNNEYDEINVDIPNPLPDRMCAVCGTELTEEEILDLLNKFNVENELDETSS